MKLLRIDGEQLGGSDTKSVRQLIMNRERR